MDVVPVVVGCCPMLWPAVVDRGHEGQRAEACRGGQRLAVAGVWAEVGHAPTDVGLPGCRASFIHWEEDEVWEESDEGRRCHMGPNVSDWEEELC